MRFNIRSLLLATSAIALACAVLVVVYNAMTDDRPFLLIEPGMSEQEVRSLVGDPHHVKQNGDWYYSLWSPGGPMAVMFEEDRTVRDIDWSPSYE